MLHVALHFAAPVLVALAFHRPRWRSAALLMLSAMLIDLDHLLADPVYDPQRCSIGFHPLHGLPAIALYLLLVLVPLGWRRGRRGSAARAAHLVGLGLILHVALDGADCLLG